MTNLFHKNPEHRRRWRWIVAFFAVSVFVSPAVDGASSKQKDPPKRENEFGDLGIVKITRTEPAHDFILNDVQGNTLRLAGFRGRVVFLNFWATWCPPCRQEMLSMDRLYRKLKDNGLVILAVDVKESKKQVADFMKDFSLRFPALLDTDGSVSRRYGNVGLPATYLIDRNGKLIGHKPGGRNWATPEAIAFFERLLGDQKGPGLLADAGNIPINSPALPSLLYVKANGVSIHGQQDRSSETLARPSRGEKLYPLGKASAGGESWYMVTTEQGIIGWVRTGDVEQIDAKDR